MRKGLEHKGITYIYIYIDNDHKECWFFKVGDSYINLRLPLLQGHTNALLNLCYFWRVVVVEEDWSWPTGICIYTVKLYIHCKTIYMKRKQYLPTRCFCFNHFTHLQLVVGHKVYWDCFTTLTHIILEVRNQWSDCSFHVIFSTYSTCLKWCLPQHMEPENHPFEKDNSSSKSPFWGMKLHLWQLHTKKPEHVRAQAGSKP